MSEELGEDDFQRFWRRLQQLGLNAYESRSYLVLLGHPKFKALELAARAHVPRQKIYEVLDSLVEKGFAQVVQEKTKLFSAVEPAMAIPSYILRRRQALEHELAEQSQSAEGLIDELKSVYNEGQVGRESWWNLAVELKQPLLTLCLLPDITFEDGQAGASGTQLHKWQLEQLGMILKDVDEACWSEDSRVLSHALEHRVLPWLHGLQVFLDLSYETALAGERAAL